MSDGLDVIIVDDEQDVLDILTESIRSFYTWGEIYSFTDYADAAAFCHGLDKGIMLFVLDVFVGQSNGFQFLDAVSVQLPSAHQDTIMITGKASEDIVDMCVASGVHHLLEKPVRHYALQMSLTSIVMKYLNFAKRVLQDPDLVEFIEKMG
ncbi:MAG: response regulator [Desulfomonilia bacterium]